MNLQRRHVVSEDMGIAFGDLPPEMLISIISHIDNEADLLNLSLVSKQVSALVQPALYSRYLNLNMDYSRSITPFLRNILKNESLARACKRVDLGDWCTIIGAWEEQLDGRTVKDLSSDDFELFASAAHDSRVVQTRHSTRNITPWHPQTDSDDDDDDAPCPKLDTDEDFLRTLRGGLEEPQVVLLLSCLPRMEELCLRGVDVVEEKAFWKKMAFNTNALKKLTLSRSPGANGFIFAGVEPLLRLPSLRELKALCPEADNDRGSQEGPGLELEEKSLSLTHLTLEGGAFSVGCMSSLIAACKHLASLTYTIYNKYKEPGSGPNKHFVVPELKKWLLAHKDSLKHLTIDFNKWHYNHDYETIGSLDQFTTLETLAIDYGSLRWHPPVNFIHPIDGAANDIVEESNEANLSPPLPSVLPSSLRELTVFHSPPKVLESLMAIEETPVAKLPWLTKVHVHFATCTFQNYPLHHAARDMLMAAGIRFVATHTNPRKTLESELIDNGDFFRTRWDEDKKKYISASATWDQHNELDEHGTCSYHSELLPQDFIRTLDVLQGGGSDGSDEDGMGADLLEAIMDYHGMAPYMHGFLNGDMFDDDGIFDDDLDDEDIDDELDDEFDDELYIDGGLHAGDGFDLLGDDMDGDSEESDSEDDMW